MSHTLRRGVLAAALAGAFILAVPAAASAHVGVSPDRIPPGESTLLTFSFSHGCEESPTTALRVTMPEGIGGAWPTFDSDWSADIEKTAGDKVSAVTFTAVKPVPQGLRGMVGLTVITDKHAADELVFPVEQRCVTGANEWTQVAKDGEDPHSLDAPAPVVSLAGAEAADATGHGDQDGAAGAAGDDPSTSALPLVLGGGGLAVGIVALVLAIGAYRRR
ncbi:uncharacterized protein YcnI [Microbacterium sp. W4I4]|uniref:DUF1775 domain-containing protein n=1 Tax=Microbacterium sp. W4I4 TaxID=3042295 RepID=UPI002784ACDB|nr:DUF1775 domain-containing protein [Microbacterium sp. W4I4]MDQ0613174.1 uncharacterized protein YcnI [Microbacterium sp. W4I4]